MGVKTNTIKVDGGASAVQVAVEDGHRRYIGLYAQDGSCVISVGSGVHADTAITIAQGNIFEPHPDFTSEVYYSGAATTLLIITDIDRPTVLTYDDLVLTYSGTVLTYKNADHDKYLPDPVFV